jgi:hypothetical protein
MITYNGNASQRLDLLAAPEQLATLTARLGTMLGGVVDIFASCVDRGFVLKQMRDK